MTSSSQELVAAARAGLEILGVLYDKLNRLQDLALSKSVDEINHSFGSTAASAGLAPRRSIEWDDGRNFAD
jgi:hypothetical protein